MKTLLPKKLYEEVLTYYEAKKESKYIVSKSLPVLFFGDLKKYFQSDLKVITVGKNPSGHEFLGDNRFPNYRKTPYSLELSLCEYFKTNPYRKWFRHYDNYLKEFGSSFYNNSNYNKVVHTDIGSPLSTDPTWKKLDDLDSSFTKELFSSGFKIWEKLVLELKPHLVIMCCPFQDSMKKDIFTRLKVEEIETICTITHKINNEPRKIPFKLTYNSIVVGGFSTKLIYGGPSVINPFGIIGTENVKLLGKKTEALIKREGL